jgi:predicted aconitase
MKLNDDEKRMLGGDGGPAAQKAMEILVALGEVYGAERCISVRSAHVAGLSFRSHGIAGMEWAEEMARSGARVVVPTTMNVVGVDRSRDLGLPADWSQYQLRIERAYEAMGCYGTSSCVPYYLGFLPRLRESIAWAESSAVVFTNSVLGARTNREGGPSALAAGLTGRTPLYGLHLDENRKGNLLVRVSAALRDLADFGALGSYVGRLVGTGIPVFDGVPAPRIEELVYLGAALASSGSVALFHMVGVTPEAPTMEAAFAGKRHETIQVGEKELQAGRDQLTAAKTRRVDYVALGCPHLSLRQIQEVAALLDGKQVADGVTMWVHTNVAMKNLAYALGYGQTIEKAGATLTQDLCTVLSIPEALGLKVLATNSGKMAFYAPHNNNMEVWFGGVAQCVRAAITGAWPA